MVARGYVPSRSGVGAGCGQAAQDVGGMVPTWERGIQSTGLLSVTNGGLPRLWCGWRLLCICTPSAPIHFFSGDDCQRTVWMKRIVEEDKVLA